MARPVLVRQCLFDAVRVLENPLFDIFACDCNNIVFVIAVCNHVFQFLDVRRVRVDRAVRAHPDNRNAIPIVAHGVGFNLCVRWHSSRFSVLQTMEAVRIASIRISSIIAVQDALNTGNNARVHASFGFLQWLRHISRLCRNSKAVAVVVSATQIADDDIFIR